MFRIHYHTYTNAQEQSITQITWTVKFRDLLEKKASQNLNLYSETCKDISGNPPQSKLQLKMQFLGHNCDIIEIYFLVPIPMFLSYRIIYCTGKNYIIAEKDSHNIPRNKWQYIATLDKEDILAKTSQRLDDNVDLSIQLQFIENNNVKSIAHKKDENLPATLQYSAQLSKNFEDLLNNGLYSDFTIKSADGYEYKVHRAILASRSVVLKAHFDHNTIECSTNQIESPFEADVLQEVLAFIYTNKALNIDKISEKLLAAADYYQLDDLMSLCEECFFRRLTAENAMELLQLADNHGANNLKQSIMEFIRDGPSTLITNTEGWANIESVKLMKDVCKYIMGADVDLDKM